MSPTPQRPAETPRLWLPIGIAALGVVLRLWHLTSWDFWTDEIHTITISSTGEWSFGPAYVTAPINFILTSWSIGAFGLNELGGRFVPFVAGCLTVWLVYWFGRRWVGHRAAVFAELVMALSMWHVYWSQNARHFSLQVLMVLLALHAFLAYWKGDRRGALWLVPVLFIGALAVHSSSVFFLAAGLVFVCSSAAVHMFGWAGDKRELDARHVRAFVALTVAMAVFVPVSIWVGSYLAETVAPWNPLWNLIGSLVFYVPPYLGLAALAGAVVLHREGTDLGLLLLTFVIVPVILLIVASRLTIASAPYVVSMMVPIAWLTGACFDRLLSASEGRTQWAASVLLVAGILLSQLGDLTLYHSEYRGLKPRWRDAAEFIDANRSPGDLVVAPEADVVAHYIGWDQVMWFGQMERNLRNGTFPPPEATGVWYVAYTSDRILIQGDADAQDHAESSAEFRTLLPMHYGPKDRTLGVFYQPLDEGR